MESQVQIYLLIKILLRYFSTIDSSNQLSACDHNQIGTCICVRTNNKHEYETIKHTCK